jgi:hypothetical protein
MSSFYSIFIMINNTVQILTNNKQMCVSQLTCSSNGMPKVFLIMISTLSAKSDVSFSIKPDRKVAENTT